MMNSFYGDPMPSNYWFICLICSLIPEHCHPSFTAITPVLTLYGHISPLGRLLSRSQMWSGNGQCTMLMIPWGDKVSLIPRLIFPGLSSQAYLPRLIFPGLSSQAYLPRLIFPGLSSQAYLPRLIFPGLSSQAYLPRLIFPGLSCMFCK